MLDIACGSGVWGSGITEADREARIVAQDYAAILDLTRRCAQSSGVLGRFKFLPGDLNEVEFGEAAYDLALLGLIVHGEGERASRRLFVRLRHALKPGGRLAIVALLASPDRAGPLAPVLSRWRCWLKRPKAEPTRSKSRPPGSRTPGSMRSKPRRSASTPRPS